jgi:hypothetical protein
VKLVSPQLITSIWWRLARDRRLYWYWNLPLYSRSYYLTNDGKNISRGGEHISTKYQIAIKYAIEWLAQLSEPFPEEIVYAAETNLGTFTFLMGLHEYYHLAFDEHNIPLAIAIAGDSALYHMKRYCNSRDEHSPFPQKAFHALARSREGLHKTFEFLITSGIVAFITDEIMHDALSNHLITVETMDLLLSRSEKLTAELIYTAARNHWDLAWHLIKKNEAEVSVIKLLEILDKKWTSQNEIKSLLPHLSHFRSIDITGKIVMLVDLQGNDVRLPFVDALLRQTDRIYIEPEAAGLIFSRFPINFTRVLLQRQDITLSALVSILEAGALAQNKTSILDLIFEHLDKISLTEDLIRNAAGHSMLHSVLGRYAREYIGLCKLFLPQIGVNREKYAE